MFNQSTILDCFKNLIGFEENTDTDYPTIGEELQVSESGVKVQQLHPLLSTENLANCARVKDEEFDAYLSNRRNTAINKLINSVFASKHLNENSKELITEVRMYEGIGNFNDKIVKQGRFVGFRLDIIQADLSLLLRHIGLQIDQANAQFKLYIYHSSKSEPLATITIAHNKPISFTWFNFEKQILPRVAGAGYLVGYYEDDLIGQAIKREQYFKRKPACSTCNAVNYDLYNKWSKFLSIQPFYVNANDLPGDKTKWEENAEIYLDGTNWGMNLALSLICDLSGLFCRNRELFIDALSKQLMVEFLTDIAYSGRDNQLKQSASPLAFLALGTKDQPGLTVDLEKTIKALNFNTSDLNSLCLPCQDNNFRIGYKSVFK